MLENESASVPLDTNFPAPIHPPTAQARGVEFAEHPCEIIFIGKRLRLTQQPAQLVHGFRCIDFELTSGHCRCHRSARPGMGPGQPFCQRSARQDDASTEIESANVASHQRHALNAAAIVPDQATGRQSQQDACGNRMPRFVARNRPDVRVERVVGRRRRRSRNRIGECIVAHGGIGRRHRVLN